DVPEVAPFLQQLDGLLGKPTDDTPPDPAPALMRVLREAGDRLSQEWGQKLAELPVRLIEEPNFRLAGAEEAVRQVVATLEQSLRGHLSDELREIGFCRVRLGELLRLLEEPPGVCPSFHTAMAPDIGRRLYASGCKDLREAVERELSAVTPEALLELDVRLEE